MDEPPDDKRSAIAWLSGDQLAGSRSETTKKLDSSFQQNRNYKYPLVAGQKKKNDWQALNSYIKGVRSSKNGDRKRRLVACMFSVLAFVLSYGFPSVAALAVRSANSQRIGVDAAVQADVQANFDATFDQANFDATYAKDAKYEAKNPTTGDIYTFADLADHFENDEVHNNDVVRVIKNIDMPGEVKGGRGSDKRNVLPAGRIVEEINGQEIKNVAKLEEEWNKALDDDADRAVKLTVPGILPDCDDVEHDGDFAAGYHACRFDKHGPRPWWHKLLTWTLIVSLIIGTGLFAGLNLGLMGLDCTMLEIIAKGDHPKNAEAARKILPIRQQGNLLLCSLLLGNTACNAVFTLFIDQEVHGVAGTLISIFAIMIIGDIGPQSVFCREALILGAKLTPVIKIIIFLFYPICKPLALILDWWLGEEVGTLHSRKELMNMLAMYEAEGALDKTTNELMCGALKFNEKRVSDIMIPTEDCFMLSSERTLDFPTVVEVFRNGFSRIPVFCNGVNDIVGLLLTKDLIFCDPEDSIKVERFVRIFGRRCLYCCSEDTVADMFVKFKQTNMHFAIVRQITQDDEGNDLSTTVGIVTLEDVIEEIIQQEIVDETDVYVDVDNQVLAPATHKFDYRKLRLLEPNLSEEPLSIEEMHALSGYLFDWFKRENPNLVHPETAEELTEGMVQHMLMSAEVRVHEKQTSPDSVNIVDLDYIYKRGEASPNCIVVLCGRLSVLSGKEQWRSDAGTFFILGAEALTSDSAYIPDFSAYIGTDRVRYIMMTRKDLVDATSGNMSCRNLPDSDNYVSRPRSAAMRRRGHRLVYSGSRYRDLYGSSSGATATAFGNIAANLLDDVSIVHDATSIGSPDGSPTGTTRARQCRASI